MLTGVGARLRALRQQRNGTLTQPVGDDRHLGEHPVTTGVGAAQADARACCCRCHAPTGCRSTSLVGAPEVGDPRVHGTPVKRNGTTFVPLSRQPGGLQAFKMLIPDSKRPQRSAMGVHEGYEWVYVLSGRLRLLLGEHDLVLESGEVAEFDTRTPHSIGSAGGPVEVLALFGPQGERMHVRAAPRRAAAG
nr:cupin domain-containing protein [Angustibacter aerolatus]